MVWLRTLGADVPLPLQMLMAKALENSPEERYRSTRDLVVDLRRLTRQSGEVSASSPPSAVLRGNQAGMEDLRSRGRRYPDHLLSGNRYAAVALSRPAASAPGQVVQFDVPRRREPYLRGGNTARLALFRPMANGWLSPRQEPAARGMCWMRELASVEVKPYRHRRGMVEYSGRRLARSIYYSVRQTVGGGPGNGLRALGSLASRCCSVWHVAFQRRPAALLGSRRCYGTPSGGWQHPEGVASPRHPLAGISAGRRSPHLCGVRWAIEAQPRHGSGLQERGRAGDADGDDFAG